MTGDSRKSAELRRRAERELKDRKSRGAAPPVRDPVRLVHEIEVHHIELQMQNEELRRARLEVDAGLHRYTELFDFAPIGYVVLDAHGRICEANIEAGRMLGLPRGRLAGRRLQSFLAGEHRTALDGLLADVLCGDDDDAVCQTRDVTLSPGGAEVRLIASARAGVKACALVAIDDVSARKRAERALREESVRKDDFMAVLSHELRNPLVPIRSSLAVLGRAEPRGAEARDALAVAERQLDHLVHIVDDLLDVTRIARGKVRLVRGRLELGTLVGTVVEDHRPQVEARGIALEILLERDPAWVDADGTRLAQVVGNLLGNALKFTPRGGHVAVGLRRDRHQVVLEVQDDGAGIAPSVREHLFQPFVQAPQTLDRTPGGLGLGLAMVKGLVELHGGTVEASSEGLGRGSRFTVRLPAVEVPAGAQTARQPSLARASLPKKDVRRRVLLIDDNVDSTEAMASLLELTGHEVRTAYDGPAGIAIARHFEPDIVLCDIGLPEMDGYAVARAMRADPALGGTYLVALSGYARSEDRRRSAEAGFDTHLAKPPRIEALEHLIAETPRPAPSSSTLASV